VFFLSRPPARPEPQRLVVLGDSLTAPYAGAPWAGGNRSWAELLHDLRPGRIVLRNMAVPSTGSAALLAQGQHEAGAELVEQGEAPFAVLIVGANDMLRVLEMVLQTGRVDPVLLAGLVANVAAALDRLQAAGARVVLGNVPDISVAPRSRQLLAGLPHLSALITGVTRQKNADLEKLARRRGAPLVDLFGLNNLPHQGRIVLGGRDVTAAMYSVDGFHPSTLGQGLLANAVLEGLRRAYDADVSGLRLTDAELLAAVGLTPAPVRLRLFALGASVLGWMRRRV
jgi:lysophospholipase L1-like esterase